jgi:peptidoglycan/xylan/chitin deacetylase (PgdA/CDA1 family)
MILLYHKVHPQPRAPWWLSTERFLWQMQRLKGRQVVYLDEYDPEDERNVVITFDDVYDNTFEHAFPVLKRLGYPFELFVVGDYIGKQNTFDGPSEHVCRLADIGELQEMTRHGGRLQWHTATHPILPDCAAGAAAREFLVPAALRALFPAPHFQWFAYPYGEFSEACLARARTRFSGALACESGSIRGNRYAMPRIVIRETAEAKAG